MCRDFPDLESAAKVLKADGYDEQYARHLRASPFAENKLRPPHRIGECWIL